MEAVTAILLEREREASSFKPMVTYSIIAHAIVIAFIALGPVKLTGRPAEAPKTSMNISLGGGPPGPRAGGMTPISARPIQTTAPAPDLTKRAPVLPPAAKAPEMVLPSKTGKIVPKNAATDAPDDAKGRTASKGAETRSGSALTETGVTANVVGFAGLSTAGGGGTGGYLDVADFCCPEYLQTMLDLIHRNWNPKQGVVSENLMKFTIQKDGTLAEIEVERPSGNDIVDLASKRALILTKRMPPLPSAFTNDRLTVHLKFRYEQ